MVGKASPIGFVSPQTASCLRQCFWLFANVRASSPMFLALPPTVLWLRKCFCLSANGFMSPTIFFASSPMVSCLRPLSLLLRQRQDVLDDCLCFIDHGRYACGHCLRICDRAFPFPIRINKECGFRKFSRQSRRKKISIELSPRDRTNCIMFRNLPKPLFHRLPIQLM